MTNKDKRECDIVQDLLPLYCDGACSDSSKNFVETHIEQCDKCKKVYGLLNDHSVETAIARESASILERHAKREKTAAYKAGIVIAAILLLPIIISFIVTLAGGAKAGTFMVIVASMLLVAALTVVPLMSGENRFAKMIVASVIALLLIIFFVDRLSGGGSFVQIAIPTVFGLSIVFFPFVIRAAKLPPVLSDKKAVITMAWDTVFLYLTIFIVCFPGGNLEGLRVGNIVATIFVILAWIILVVCRYVKVSGFIKAGIITFLCGIWTAFGNDVCDMFIYDVKHLTIAKADFSDWGYYVTANANIYLLTLMICTASAVILCAIGIARMRRKKGLRYK